MSRWYTKGLKSLNLLAISPFLLFVSLSLYKMILGYAREGYLFTLGVHRGVLFLFGVVQLSKS
jgi:hypothetical protein